MMPLLTISRAEFDADPSARFWAVIMYLAEHPEEQACAEVEPVWLAYIYDAEVKNGGHLQYFHNRGTEKALSTADALHRIGAIEHARLLSDCWRKVQDEPVSRVKSLEEYSVLASDRSFTVEDSAYYKLPDVLDLLESHYAKELQAWVSIGA